MNVSVSSRCSIKCQFSFRADGVTTRITGVHHPELSTIERGGDALITISCWKILRNECNYCPYPALTWRSLISIASEQSPSELERNFRDVSHDIFACATSFLSLSFCGLSWWWNNMANGLATCRRILTDKFPAIDDELFKYVTGIYFTDLFCRVIIW